MKILIIFILLFVLTIMWNIGTDLFMGMDLTNAFKNMKNPFWVMTAPEYILLFGFLAIIFLQAGISYFKKKKPPTSSNNQ